MCIRGLVIVIILIIITKWLRMALNSIINSLVTYEVWFIRIVLKPACPVIERCSDVVVVITVNSSSDGVNRLKFNGVSNSIIRLDL